METTAGTAYQFGAFEVNADSGELLKQGKRVRLQEQPFRLLVVLLENAGQLFTREDLKTLIWEGTTFVDFDSSLRVAVRKLRDALGDDAENPRYVETIPKRGYRFLGPVVRPAANKNHAEEINAAVVDRSIGEQRRDKQTPTEEHSWTATPRFSPGRLALARLG